MLTDKQITELLALEEKATPGEMVYEGSSVYALGADGFNTIYLKVDTWVNGKHSSDEAISEAESTAGLIAKSRNSIRAALLELQTHRKREGELLEALKEARCWLPGWGHDTTPASRGALCETAWDVHKLVASAIVNAEAIRQEGAKL